MRKSKHKKELTPPVVISQSDHDRLTRLVLAFAEIAPEVSDYLSRELDRAKTVAATGPEIVRMGSWVRYLDEVTAREQEVQLVFPPEADISARKISIMTPIGVTIIGLAVGKSITFYTPDGKARNLTIVGISDEPQT